MIAFRPGSLIAGLAAMAGLAIATAAHAGDCAALASQAAPGAEITSAAEVAAGEPAYKGAPPLPAFCRVKGFAARTIGFEVWLPAAGWNGRLLSVGNGGFGGDLQYFALAQGLQQGYAVTGNDTGHQGQDRAWMRDRERVRLWGHSATHLVTAPAKAITAAYYGQSSRFAYFVGCSTGGAQAMEEAEYYPGDYDGIVAGAPGMSYARLMLSFLWGLKIATAYPDSALSPEKLQLLHGAVLKVCGDADGLVDDPQACRFDPRTLTCKGADAPDCLTPHQVETAIRMYDGPRNPRTGERIYPGFAYGSEADTPGGGANPFAYGWGGIQGPLAQMFAIPLLRDMVYQDPDWDWRKFDWDHDVSALDRRVGADITAVDPDLRAFRARGGKLLMYQGWGDPLNAPLPVDYRRQVIAVFAHGKRRAAATAEVDGFFRLFMAPGMAHCQGGPGPSKFDSLAALRAWVEEGRAPERLLAVQDRPGAPAQDPDPMTRPLCPYPQVARWSGQGSTRRAESFTCKAPAASAQSQVSNPSRAG